MLRQVYLALTLACFAALASSTRELVLTSGLDALNKIKREAQKLDDLGALYSLEKPISSYDEEDPERLKILEKMEWVRNIVRDTWKPEADYLNLQGRSENRVKLLVGIDFTFVNVNIPTISFNT